MSLFDNGDPEEFFLFVRNFNMTLAVAGTLESDAKFQYLHTILHGEALRQFNSLFDAVESAETLDVNYIIWGLSQYFFSVSFLSKQKRTMCRGMKTAQSNRNMLCGALD